MHAVCEYVLPQERDQGPSDREKLYGNLEWGFKWFKIFVILILCITMLVIKAGGEHFDHGQGSVWDRSSLRQADPIQSPAGVRLLHLLHGAPQ